MKQDETRDLGRLLGWCGHLVHQRMNENLCRYDLTPAQAHVILYLLRSPEPGRVNQRALEAELRVRPSTVNGIVERLEERGFITRRTGEHDARCRYILVTEKGRVLEKELSAGIAETERRITHGFSTEETEQVAGYLERMIRNLTDGGKGGTKKL